MDTELFILGIDSPNKDASASTNVYNYGIYLENGTLLDHNEACKESKILISSPIINPELVKLNEASYFSDMGYDIFNENSNFYNDNCAPASINGNDIILSDRKKDFYPSNISLCNDSCYYSQVDFNTKRFTCECDLFFNFSEKDINKDIINEEKNNINYIEYLLSLINYKIITCYDLFFEYKSYYYNAGFYIAGGTLLFCFLQIFIFITCGLKKMNINILENVPDTKKIKNDKINLLQNGKSELNALKENPPRKKNIKIEGINASDSGQNLNKKEDNNSKKNLLLFLENQRKLNQNLKQLKKRKLY